MAYLEIEASLLRDSLITQALRSWSFGGQEELVLVARLPKVTF